MILDKYKGIASIDDMRADLSPLHTVFSKIEEGGISEAQSEQIRNEIEEIRNKAVNF